MQICTTKKQLAESLAAVKGRSIGLVPTMGALHQGHASLFQKARAENDIFVASVFVNPIQFNNPDDLKTYPRDFEADCRLLESCGCDIVFHPSAEEMYPENESIESYDFGDLEKVMEGKNRPGHFQGVGVVVNRLFQLVRPQRAYFGEKDIQQLAIIKRLVELTHSPIEIVPCPIKREDDGLALSSRNQRLTPAQRALAPHIYRILKESLALKATHDLTSVRQWVADQIAAYPEMELEYYQIVDAVTMQPIQNWKDAKEIIGCIVVLFGSVRLIDNIRYQ